VEHAQLINLLDILGTLDQKELLVQLDQKEEPDQKDHKEKQEAQLDPMVQ
jgi:hypothetical protein